MQRGRRLPILPAALGLLASLALSACNGGGDTGGSGLKIAISATPPPGGVSQVIWIGDAGRAGDLQLVEVEARDLSDPFDAFDLEITFDPLVAEVVSATSGGVLDACSSLPVLKADNIANGNAGATGTILYSESVTGTPPPGCVVGGERPMARFAFRAAARGASPLAFVPYNGDPNQPSGTRLTRTDPPVPSVPVQLYDSGATLDVTR